MNAAYRDIFLTGMTAMVIMLVMMPAGFPREITFRGNEITIPDARTTSVWRSAAEALADSSAEQHDTAAASSSRQELLEEYKQRYAGMINASLEKLSGEAREAAETIMAKAGNDVRAAASTNLNGELHVFLGGNAAVDPDMLDELRATVTITDQGGNTEVEDWALDTSMFSYNGRGIDLMLPPELDGQTVTFEFYGITEDGETVSIGSNAVTFEVDIPEFFQVKMPDVVEVTRNDDGELIAVFYTGAGSFHRSDLESLWAYVTYTNDDGETVTENWELDPYMIALDGSYVILPDDPSIEEIVLYGIKAGGGLTTQTGIVLDEYLTDDD